MNLLDFVNSIPFDGLSYLWINGYEFHWNGFSGKRLNDNLRASNPQPPS